MTKFKREDRYIVLKKSRLTKDQIDHLTKVIAMSDMIDSLVNCVVVESDWPEYEPVWKMIEKRVSGNAIQFPESMNVERRDDMSQTGKLRLSLQDDGDIGISLFKNDDSGGLGDGWISLEFCDTGAGGGRSKNTLTALRNLMIAIEEDNQHRPTE